MRSGHLIPARGQVFITGGSCHRYHFYRDKSKFRHLCYKRVFVATKHVFCRDKSMLVTKLLSRQKDFVATNIILSPQNFCHDKYTFVATKDVFCRDTHVFVATKVCFSHIFVATKHVFCLDKHALVVRRIRDGEPRTATSTFTQLLNSELCTGIGPVRFSVALRLHRP